MTISLCVCACTCQLLAQQFKDMWNGCAVLPIRVNQFLSQHKFNTIPCTSKFFDSLWSLSAVQRNNLFRGIEMRAVVLTWFATGLAGSPAARERKALFQISQHLLQM